MGISDVVEQIHGDCDEALRDPTGHHCVVFYWEVKSEMTFADMGYFFCLIAFDDL